MILVIRQFGIYFIARKNRWERRKTRGACVACPLYHGVCVALLHEVRACHDCTIEAAHCQHILPVHHHAALLRIHVHLVLRNRELRAVVRLQFIQRLVVNVGSLGRVNLHLDLLALCVAQRMNLVTVRVHWRPPVASLRAQLGRLLRC